MPDSVRDGYPIWISILQGWLGSEDQSLYFLKTPRLVLPPPLPIRLRGRRETILQRSKDYRQEEPCQKTASLTGASQVRVTMRFLSWVMRYPVDIARTPTPSYRPKARALRQRRRVQMTGVSVIQYYSTTEGCEHYLLFFTTQITSRSSPYLMGWVYPRRGSFSFSYGVCRCVRRFGRRRPLIVGNIVSGLGRCDPGCLRR